MGQGSGDVLSAGFDSVVWLHGMLIRQPDPAAEGEALRPGRLAYPTQWRPRLSPIRPYQCISADTLELPKAQDFHDLSEPQVNAAIQRIVAAEGPVHFAVLADRLLEAAGIKRLGGNIRHRIESQLELLGSTDVVKWDGEWAASPLQLLEPPYRDWREAPAKTRQLAHVHDTELMHAIFHAVFNGDAATQEAAMNAGLHAIGFIRFTEAARQRLARPMARLLEGQMLTAEGPEVRLGKKAFLQ